MGLTSLQVCMDSVDWLQGAIQEDSGIDSSSPSGEMLTCSRPLIERRLRPQHDQALKCPRCDSTHTKFCYYNNYSLSQPRYFCKTCRRYWTKGGTLRNIPVGGGCRKNKKVATKKPSDPHQSINHNYPGSSSTDLHLSFPDHQMQFSHLNNMLGNDQHHGSLGNPSFMLENPRNYDFMGNGDHLGSGILAPNFHNFCSPFGVNSHDGTFMDTCQRLMLPYHDQETEDQNAVEVKPNTRLLSLEHWQDQGQGCSDAGKDTFGYINSVGSWTGMMNGYGQSATNPLV